MSQAPVASQPASASALASSLGSSSSGGSGSSSALGMPPFSGAGQDFVLFDDAFPGASLPMPAQTPGGEWGTTWGSSSSGSSLLAPAGVPVTGGAASSAQPSMAARPAFDSNPSFMQYRGAPAGLGPADSPFSSPASRPEDDFGTSPGSGSGSTVDPRSGMPSKKRARGAHAYSSSWAGSAGKGGVPGLGGVQRDRVASQGSAPGGPGDSPLWVSDNSLSPPSGSLGAPLNSLSLGDGSDGADVSFESLFPNYPHQQHLGGGDNDEQQQRAHAQAQAQAQALLALSLGASGPSATAPMPTSMPNMPGFSGAPLGRAGSLPNAERVRQQVRSDLAGVDPRALKGPLRNIQQGQNGGGFPLNNQQPAFSGAPDFSAVQQMQNFGPSRGAGDADQQRPNAPRRRSGSLDSSMFPSQTDLFGGMGAWQGGAPMESSMSWDGGLMNYLASFNQPQFQQQQQQQMPPQQQQMMPDQQLPQQQQQAQQQPAQNGKGQAKAAQKAARGRPPAAGRGRGRGGGRPEANGRPGMTRDRSGLTVSPHETLLEYEPPSGNMFSLFQTSAPPVPGLADSLARATALQQQRFQGNTESVSTPTGPPAPQRAPLDRNETARPSVLQREAMERATTASSTSGPSREGSAGSGPSLFSPPETFGTPSSDDEDEAMFRPAAKAHAEAKAAAAAAAAAGGQMPGFSAHFPFPAQRIAPGPRFGDVSSSSSESEGEGPMRGRHSGSGQGMFPRQQGMGGYGYMAGSQESGLSVAAASLPGALAAAGHAGAQAARSRSASSAQDDDGSVSPSIRSSAQALPGYRRELAGLPAHGPPVQPDLSDPRQRERSRSRPRPAGANASPQGGARRPLKNTSASEDGDDDEDAWESGDTEDETGESDYAEGSKPSRPKAAGIKKRRRPPGEPGAAASSAASKEDHGIHVPLPKAVGGSEGPSSAAMHSAANAAGITTCDYVLHSTGEICGTEFHRPYDLARHRETIHGKEEAQLLRQGKLRKEDCAVLYKEVDPEKSLATVEWKCDGRNGCGSVFSR